jgi:Carboxypeptidase regulatory-like domain/TonB dependent receptor
MLKSIATKTSRVLCYQLLLIVLSSTGLYAQFSSGIEGTVTDASGAAVPGATIRLRNLNTATEQTIKSSGAGYYRFNALPAAPFELTVSSPGFETVVQQGIQLEVSNITTINLKLPVGVTQQEVTVTGVPPEIQTADPKVSDLISQNEVHELPLIGRNFYTLVVLTPGVTGLPSGGGQAYAQASADIFNGEYGVNMNANGLRSEQNEFSVDGISVTSMVRGGVANMNPSADSVQELRVSVNDFSAEFTGAGAHVNAITKGGTNSFHGNGDWFTTNNNLQARNEFQAVVPVFTRNEFAGAFGGPIVKDRTFFFGSVDVLRSSVAFATNSTVETPDFVNWMAQNLPTHVSTAILTKYPSAIKTFASTQDAGQLVTPHVDCTTLASPSTPIATQAGNVPCNLDVLGTGRLNVTTPRNGLQWGVRADQVFNQSRDRFFASTFRTNVEQISGSPSPYYPAFTTTEPEYTLNAHVEETHIFAPSLLNDAVGSYVRLNGLIPCTQCEVPRVTAVTGSSGVGDTGPIAFVQNNFEFRDNVSWDRGAHNLKFGGNLLKLQSNFNPNQYYTRPTFAFSSPFALAADAPFSEANFYFNPVTGSRSIPTVAERQPIFGLYFQDTWKLKSTLTLNLGLRWETFGKVTEATEVTNFIFQGGTDLVSKITNAKVGIVPSILTKLRYGNFGPRISLAWDPTKTGKASVRAGFGRFYDPYTSQVYGGSHYNPPIAAAGTASIFQKGPQPLFALGTSGTAPFNFPYPAGIVLGLNPSNGLLNTQVAITGTDPQLPTAYSQNWFFGLQYSFAHDWVVEADYIGSEGHHLYELYNVNRFAGDLIQNVGVLKRYNPNFGAMSYAQANLNSSYTGSTFAVRNRRSRALNVSAAYTLGKAIDEQSSFSEGDVVDAANPGRERARSDFDARQKFTLSAIYQIPTGNVGSGFLKPVISGWQLSDVAILQAGTPFQVYCTAAFGPVYNAAHTEVIGNTGCDYNADGNNYDRPNTPSFGNSRSASRSGFITGLFKPSDFPAPPLGQEGNLGRNTFVGPGFAESDLALDKHTQIPWFGGDKADAEFRAEAFNVFNRVNLTTMQSDLNGSAATFGKATSSFGARDFQFGIRFSF